jgi:hypothetical protein
MLYQATDQRPADCARRAAIRTLIATPSFQGPPREKLSYPAKPTFARFRWFRGQDRASHRLGQRQFAVAASQGRSRPPADANAETRPICLSRGMTGRYSAVSSASPPKPPSKSSRNAPHPTTRKRPRETLRPFAPTPRHLASLVVADAFAGELTRGSFKTIPATEETTNTQRFEEDSWLRDPDSNQD